MAGEYIYTNMTNVKDVQSMSKQCVWSRNAVRSTEIINHYRWRACTLKPKISSFSAYFIPNILCWELCAQRSSNFVLLSNSEEDYFMYVIFRWNKPFLSISANVQRGCNCKVCLLQVSAVGEISLILLMLPTCYGSDGMLTDPAACSCTSHKFLFQSQIISAYTVRLYDCTYHDPVRTAASQLYEYLKSLYSASAREGGRESLLLLQSRYVCLST